MGRDSPYIPKAKLYIREAVMTKVLIDIDDEALGRASELLGPKTKKDTVNTVLREYVRQRERAVALAEMRELVAEGALDPDVLADKGGHRT
jgi:Arc/MetJ family transcription regulator